VGKYTSIALDSGDNPHITCYDDTAGNLRYFYWNEGDNSWWGTSFDTGDIGKYSSLVLDENDNPHICYYDDTNGDLKYKYYSEGVWHTETVDSEGDVGRYCSIALNSAGNPAISYYDATNTSLKCARRISAFGGHIWMRENVDNSPTTNVGQYSSIAIDPSNNKIHISYYDSTNTNLKYALWNGDNWTIENVDKSPDDVGMYSSIALNPHGVPYISYYDSTNGDLKYAYKVLGTWLTETVDSEGDVGKYTSIAVNDSNIHISYASSTDSSLKYAKYESGVWKIENVDTEGHVGLYTSLAVDSGGYPHISYYDAWNANLMYAKMNAPPTLSEPSVSPTSGPWGETFTFQVTYQDNDNDVPLDVCVYIDGIYHKMNYVSGDHQTGAIYQYKWVTDSGNIGDHSHYFGAHDGSAVTRLPPSPDNYDGPTVTQHPPVADFTFTPTTPSIGDVVHFNDASTDDDGTIVSWSWDFGDGSPTSSEQNPAHQFTSSGSYTVTLTVTDNDGATGNKSKIVHVGGVNQAPTLSSGFVSPDSGEAGTVFTYEVTYADPDGDIPSYVRVYIDGVSHPMTKVSGTYMGGAVYRYEWATSAGDSGSHDYHFEASDGTNDVRLPETENYQGPEVVAPGEHAPTLTSGSVTPETGIAGTTFTFQVIYSDNDNDAPTFVYLIIDGSIKQMTKVGENSYTDGVLYKYEWVTSPEEIGEHEYYFMASDGEYRGRLPATNTYHGPTITGTTYKIYGYVTSNGEPVQGATVSLDGQSVTTDQEGYYEFSGLEAYHTYTIQVSAEGYQTYSESVFVGEEDKSLDIALSKSVEGGADWTPIAVVAIILVIGGLVLWKKRK